MMMMMYHLGHGSRSVSGQNSGQQHGKTSGCSLQLGRYDLRRGRGARQQYW